MVNLPPPDHETSPEPQVVRFSVLRLCLATAVVSIVFAVMRPLGEDGVFPGVLLAVSLGGLTLIASRKNADEILRAIGVCLLVIAVLTLLCVPGV